MRPASPRRAAPGSETPLEDCDPRRGRAIRRRLLAWWDAGHRRLPWRFAQRGADPYRVWIAEVMLQQTQVRTVVPYYQRFVERFPTLEALARAREDEVLALWSGLGYYARGRNLLAAAREAVRRHGGLPASLEALSALPGFGPYTAGAVASIAFAIPAAAVDGNVARVLARLFAVEGDPASAAFRSRIGALAAALVGEGERRPSRMRLGRSERRAQGQPDEAAPKRAGDWGVQLHRAPQQDDWDRGGASRRRVSPRPDRPGDLNQALMELGATSCVKRAPACRRCPLAPLCLARASRRAAELPAPRRRPARPALVLACAIVRRRGSLLLVRRAPRGLFGGLWAPPAAEAAPGEDARRALARALRREHGLRCAPGEEVAACERTLTHRALTLRAFRCEPPRGLATGDALRWAPEAELAGWGLPSAVRALLARV